MYFAESYATAVVTIWHRLTAQQIIASHINAKHCIKNSILTVRGKLFFIFYRVKEALTRFRVFACRNAKHLSQAQLCIVVG